MKHFNQVATKQEQPAKLHFAYEFIAPFLVVLASGLVYMWATGQLDLWRFGIAS